MEKTEVAAVTASRRNPSEVIAKEYLSFVLDSEVYGVDLSRVQSIMVVPELTEVPRAPRYVVGICSVRGVLVTVVDLRRRMSVPEKPLTRQARVLLTSTPEHESIGLLVDAVRYVVRPKPEEVELTGPVFGNELTEHVVGIARVSASEDEPPPKRGTSAAGSETAVARRRQRQRQRQRDDVIVLLGMDTICGPSLGRQS